MIFHQNFSDDYFWYLVLRVKQKQSQRRVGKESMNAVRKRKKLLLKTSIYEFLKNSRCSLSSLKFMIITFSMKLIQFKETETIGIFFVEKTEIQFLFRKTFTRDLYQLLFAAR